MFRSQETPNIPQKNKKNKQGILLHNYFKKNF